MAFGNAENHRCLSLQISPETLSGTSLRDSGVKNLLEKLLNPLQNQGFAPRRFSQQYKSQQDLPGKVFYVEGCLLPRRGDTTRRATRDD